MSRLLALTIADAGREILDRRRTRRQGMEPRLDRGGVYPLLRAATTTILRDITLFTLMSDVYRGVPAAYADFVGYDEVAHHSGVAAPTALDTLRRLDHQLRRLERSIADAPRPYHVVVLSDHGQSQGATFLQRYGITLEQLVRTTTGGAQIAVPTMASEGWGNLNGALTEIARDEDSRLGALMRRATRHHVVDGDVVYGPAYTEAAAVADGDTSAPVDADVIVLASGNLGLISFTDIEGRADLETIGQRHPQLLSALAQHPGIGFVMVRSQELGALVIGATGVRYLVDDRIEGTDPLASFGPNTADHLRRTDSFVNAPDILVNSFYDPHAQEGAAFEELIGFHGGLGGSQSEPFLLYSATLRDPDEPIVGAATVHHIFKGWMADTRAHAVADRTG